MTTTERRLSRLEHLASENRKRTVQALNDEEFQALLEQDFSYFLFASPEQLRRLFAWTDAERRFFDNLPDAEYQLLTTGKMMLESNGRECRLVTPDEWFHPGRNERERA